ncbi:SusD/RagB family nutrient-binding outer membrane lipoprotein [Sphingobacterium mizutaii]|uniref:SusD/RagB family nutrient-binding outer membrane lipoprotein n=1 Tax=Sphingobacterium mizutaii TaxID=1010 RepID=UPI0028AC3455|nr:SusD/RagB family nutrient-binding outer membrane lipoprotein [Sphingobacterium mizutaii]
MKKYIICLLTAGIILQGCSKFEEINIDPNNPSTVPTELLLPPIISKAVSTMTASGRRAGQYVQHLAYTGGTSEGDGRFNLDGAAWREEWNGALRVTKDINQMIKLSQEAKQPQYEALAYINKVYILSLVTDAFGDIPYDQAGMGNVDGFEFAKYQSQEEVYSKMLEDLDKANTLLSNLPANSTISKDILFNGNPALWRKFANSLKVRILMRQSAKKNVGAAVAEIFNNPTKYPVFAQLSDQAVLTYNNSTDFYTWFIQNPPADGSGVNFGDNARISEVMMDLLNNSKDPRLAIYASPTRNSFKANSSDMSKYVYRGQRSGLSSLEQQAFYKDNNLNDGDFSVVGKRIRKDNRAFLMTYAELLLMKAEAIQKGYAINGDAKVIYTQAVDASFSKWAQVGSQSQLDNPYIDDNMKNQYWTEAANQYKPEVGLKMIYEQYFIDSFLNGFEGWASWRRTGIPTIKPGPSILANIPVRYVYSDNEQNNPSLLDWVNANMGGKMPNQNVKVWFQP